MRVSYVKENNALKVRDTNDYYPFGMSFLKSFGQVSVYDPMAIPYNYKLQEQELQETGFYSFKWRNYMSDVGRFFNIDPLATKYPYNTPYAFQENKMGLGRELEGLELVKDLRHAPQNSMIYTNSKTQITKLIGNSIFGNLVRKAVGNPPNNLSVETTQTSTSYVYKKGTTTVDSKSKADYLMVHQEEVKYTNDKNSLNTLQPVTASEKQTTNTYEDYTIKNGKIEQVKMDSSPIIDNTTVNLTDTPNVHQDTVTKANIENASDSAGQVVDWMKNNVSTQSEYQQQNIGVPKSELEKIPDGVKSPW